MGPLGLLICQSNDIVKGVFDVPQTESCAYLRRQGIPLLLLLGWDENLKHVRLTFSSRLAEK